MIFQPPQTQVADRNGLPLAGASLSFFQANTNTPLTVFRDAARTSPHAVSIVADLAGRFPAIFLPAASSTVQTYRVRCADNMSALIYEVPGLSLPAATAAATVTQSFALPLIPCVEDGGNLSITLTSATFNGLLSVNASASDVSVVLPALSSLTPGQNITIRQIGQGAAVLIQGPDVASLIDGYQGYPLTDTDEQACFVAAGTEFKAINWTLDRQSFLVQSRIATPIAGPVAGGFYIATATSAPLTLNGLYRADGLGNWRQMAVRPGMVAVVTGETYNGLRVSYQWTGSAWTKLPGFAAVMPVVGYHSLLPGTFPPTAKTADVIIDDLKSPTGLYLWNPTSGAYKSYSPDVPYLRSGATASGSGFNGVPTTYGEQTATLNTLAEIPAGRIGTLQLAMNYTGPAVSPNPIFIPSIRVKGEPFYHNWQGVVSAADGYVFTFAGGLRGDGNIDVFFFDTGGTAHLAATVPPNTIMEIGGDAQGGYGPVYSSIGQNFNWTIRNSN
jgi:hypothetical protein